MGTVKADLTFIERIKLRLYPFFLFLSLALSAKKRSNHYVIASFLSLYACVLRTSQIFLSEKSYAFLAFSTMALKASG